MTQPACPLSAHPLRTWLPLLAVVIALPVGACQDVSGEQDGEVSIMSSGQAVADKKPALLSADHVLPKGLSVFEGVIVQGAECLQLRTEAGPVITLERGATDSLEVGRKVRLTAAPVDSGEMTRCQQAFPVDVKAAEALD